MKNKKLLCVLLIIVFVIIICFCILFIYDKIVWKEVNINLDPEYNELFTEEEMEIKGHENLLPEYISNVSVAYGNNDGTKTLYVFSSPIVFQDTSGAISFIDIRINNVENEEKRADGYLYTVCLLYTSITVLCGTPTLFNHISGFVKRAKLIHKIKKIALSGECLNRKTAEIIRGSFPYSDIYNVYGLTEASPRVSFLSPELFDNFSESVGLPVSYTHLQDVKDCSRLIS